MTVPSAPSEPDVSPQDVITRLAEVRSELAASNTQASVNAQAREQAQVLQERAATLRANVPQPPTTTSD
jgi:hypothetical protein